MSRPKKELLTLAEKQRIRDEILAKCELAGDCWIYTGAKSSEGYGVKKIHGKTYNVSRFMLAYETRDSLTHHFDACHKDGICPYKACCNPDHLYWATHAENCTARETRAREERVVFAFWERHAWKDGAYYTDRHDPSIAVCINNLSRGKIRVQSATVLDFLDQPINLPETWGKVLDFLGFYARQTYEHLVCAHQGH